MSVTLDFHTHGKITGSFPFCEDNFYKTVAEAKFNGIDSLALTEHNRARNFEQAFEFLAANYDYTGEYYKVDGIRVYTGTEVTTTEKYDILFVGRREAVFELRSGIMRESGGKHVLGTPALLGLREFEDMAVILAHPFRGHDKSDILTNFSGLWERIDALEYNASDLCGSGFKAMEKMGKVGKIEKMEKDVCGRAPSELFDDGVRGMMAKVDELAGEVGLPVIGGSDSHHYLKIGSIATVLKGNAESAADIKAQIRDRNFEVRLSGDMRVKGMAHGLVKKLIKQAAGNQKL